MDSIPARQVKGAQVSESAIDLKFNDQLVELSKTMPESAINLIKAQLATRKLRYETELARLTSDYESDSENLITAMGLFHQQLVSDLKNMFDEKQKGSITYRPSKYIIDAKHIKYYKFDYRGNEYAYYVKCMSSIVEHIILDLKLKGYECSSRYNDPYEDDYDLMEDIAITCDFSN